MKKYIASMFLSLLLICMCLSGCAFDPDVPVGDTQIENFSSDEQSTVAIEATETEITETEITETETTEAETTKAETTEVDTTEAETTEAETTNAEKDAQASTAATEESPKSPTVTVPDSAEEGEDLVWVPTNGGTKYHTHAGCSKMIDPIQVTRATAEKNGYTPCKRCY